jgi:hypothetical protein
LHGRFGIQVNHEPPIGAPYKLLDLSPMKATRWTASIPLDAGILQLRNGFFSRLINSQTFERNWNSIPAGIAFLGGILKFEGDVVV